jgi:hypothetical protein
MAEVQTEGVSFSIAQSQSNFKLLELPEEILALITTPGSAP